MGIEIVNDHIPGAESDAVEVDDTSSGVFADLNLALDQIESFILQRKVDRAMRLIEDLHIGFYTVQKGSNYRIIPYNKGVDPLLISGSYIKDIKRTTNRLRKYLTKHK